ncbi:hypothetical protein FQR65_LT08021 [Abscondita terminalis]|nr:hypothetical protein FQR65_LT08021 [Abscondita terminalis]
MASEDRSLNSGGISIPQWMKSKISDNRFDLDQNTFSPPENDDSFLYIRYPQLIKSAKTPTVVAAETKIPCEVDYVNHTAPCKQSILNPGYKPTMVVANTPDVKIKSNGTDDGFKGEGAACGSSVVRVAHQMISGRYPVNSNPIDDDPLKPKGFQPSQRRGSRSLPASPQSSPKSRRKLNSTNKYFTGAFVDNENHSGGWLLQGLLGKRELSQSIGLITEESVKSELDKSVSDLHVNDLNKVKKEFKTKPSEFREMNFWSPTSM